MSKKTWKEIHLLELLAIFLLICTVAFYLKSYLDFEATHNTQSPYFEFKQLIEKYELLQELDLRPQQRQKFKDGYAQYFPRMQPPGPL